MSKRAHVCLASFDVITFDVVALTSSLCGLTKWPIIASPLTRPSALTSLVGPQTGAGGGRQRHLWRLRDVLNAGSPLDVEDVKFVINYDYPSNSEDYVHRIGRTGRSQRTGTAYTFFTPQNSNKAADLVSVLKEAKQVINPKLQDMADHCGSGGGRGGRWRRGPMGGEGGRSGYSGRDRGEMSGGRGDRNGRGAPERPRSPSRSPFSRRSHRDRNKSRSRSRSRTPDRRKRRSYSDSSSSSSRSRSRDRGGKDRSSPKHGSKSSATAEQEDAQPEMTQEQMQQQVLEQIAAFKSRMQTALSRNKIQTTTPAQTRLPLQNQPPQRQLQQNNSQGPVSAQSALNSTYHQPQNNQSSSSSNHMRQPPMQQTSPAKLAQPPPPPPAAAQAQHNMMSQMGYQAHYPPPGTQGYPAYQMPQGFMFGAPPPPPPPTTQDNSSSASMYNAMYYNAYAPPPPPPQ